jgi:hypothetical protein
MLELIAPIGAARRPQINAAITEVVKEFSPDVVHIRYDLKPDWSGDPAVYFRVLLSDEASSKPGVVSRKLEKRMEELLDFLWLELFAYYNFRSVSEQAVLQEKSWA